MEFLVSSEKLQDVDNIRRCEFGLLSVDEVYIARLSIDKIEVCQATSALLPFSYICPRACVRIFGYGGRHILSPLNRSICVSMDQKRNRVLSRYEELRKV